MSKLHALRTSLPDREKAILLHVARYRVSVYEVLRRKYFAGLGPTASIKVLTRLCRDGLLQRIALFHRKCGFVLTSLACKQLGVPLQRATPPGPQALPVDFATVMYATTSQGNRYRLDRNELGKLFPWITSSLAVLPHCLDESDCRLELVRVDLGGTPEHIVRKCSQDIAKRRDIDAFRQLLCDGGFRLVVITTTTGKAALIQNALDRHAWPEGLAIHLVALPHLSPFFQGAHRAS